MDFEDASALFDGRAHVSSPSPRAEEMRFATTAEFEGLLYTVIWTERGESVRVISLRRARHAEERKYRQVHG
ncbi:MAG: BrnT family toxin [Chloroflexota bacterium]|nr:BrnT family toxin [Chloroflexota bacterium]